MDSWCGSRLGGQCAALTRVSESDATGKSIYIVLQKIKKHSSWLSVVKGKDEVDLMAKESMEKRMMLEKFQRETPGFDFSGAEFSGNLPADPANFMRKD